MMAMAMSFHFQSISGIHLQNSSMRLACAFLRVPWQRTLGPQNPRLKFSKAPEIVYRSMPDRGLSVDQNRDELIKAAELVDAMTKEMLRELFLGSATNYVTGEGAMDDEVKDMLDRVVSPKIDEMPPSILPMIDSFIKAVEDDSSHRGNREMDDTIKVLLLIKGFILETLERTLPQSLQKLQKILDTDRDSRLRMYEQDVVDTGDGSLLETYKSCNSLIQTIEGQEDDDIDTNFLYKLCIIRHEMSSILPSQEIQQAVENRFTVLGGVPEDDSSFLKELVQVSDPSKRKYLILSSIKPEDTTKSARRPGTFIDCIAALQVEMISKQNGEITNESVYNRLEEISIDTIRVLEELSGDLPLLP